MNTINLIQVTDQTFDEILMPLLKTDAYADRVEEDYDILDAEGFRRTSYTDYRLGGKIFARAISDYRGFTWFIDSNLLEAGQWR